MKGNGKTFRGESYIFRTALESIIDYGFRQILMYSCIIISTVQSERREKCCSRIINVYFWDISRSNIKVVFIYLSRSIGVV